MEQPPEQSSGRRIVRTRTRAPDLGDLARQIEAEHLATFDAWNNWVERAIACGRLLIQAKERVGHGNWLAWIDNHLTLSIRQVQKYMQIARHAPDLANTPSEAHLTIDGVLALLAAPRATPAEPNTSTRPARASAAGERTVANLAPGVQPVARSPAARAPIPQDTDPEPPPEPGGHHLARLQAALATFPTLPAPDVLALVEAMPARGRAGRYRGHDALENDHGYTD